MGCRLHVAALVSSRWRLQHLAPAWECASRLLSHKKLSELLFLPCCMLGTCVPTC